MTRRAQEFLESMQGMVTDRIYISGSVRELEAERLTNMWGLQVDEELADELTAVEVEDVIDRVIRNREEQLRAQGKEATFYLWFDEQVPELRFNLISAVHTEVPFAAPVRLVDSPSSIIEAFLSSPDHDGLPLNRLLYLFGTRASEQEPEPVKVLPVYAIRLPRRRDGGERRPS